MPDNNENPHVWMVDPMCGRKVQIPERLVERSLRRNFAFCDAPEGEAAPEPKPKAKPKAKSSK